MSNEADPAVVGQQLILLNYGQLIGITILYWDHIITLDREINFLWGRNKSLSAYWFFVNRYFAFLSGIPMSALPFLTLSTAMCTRYHLFRELTLVATQIISGVIMIIRVYALYGRNRRVLWFMLGIGACVVGVSLWSFTGQKGSRSIVAGGCHFALIQSTAFRLAGSWEALFVFDTIIFTLTVYNAYITGRGLMPQMNLHALIVKDGALYFGLMALANLANIATYYYSTSGMVLPGSLATFTNCISVTMISRLILNLNEQANVGILSGLTSPVQFARQIPQSSLDDGT